MALSPGTWLNHYEILGHLGTGGMGEVYRARDNKLQREVALKVLPQAFAQDPERVARFRREAQVLAQLNHTNIAAIYSVERTGETHFLVMELALGDTLRDRIKRGPVPIEDALDISKQIAAGLECAHEKPIVHRDLKPANVKVTPEGVVKILDFGPARAFAGDTGSGDPADSPTLSAMTAPGTILGTAAYMSPEQARGKTVDKRTDIWALGCVLYELLTGKHTFPGEDVTDILGAVLHKEPDWQALPESTPATIRTLLRRCLQKDKDRRSRDASEIRLQIEEAETASATTVPAAAPAIPACTGWRRAIPWAAVFALGLIVAGIAVWNLKPAPTPTVTRTTRFIVPVEGGHEMGDGLVSRLAVSPDGRVLAYVAQGQLFIRPLDRLEAIAVEGTQGAEAPFFSPDGQWIGFSQDNALKRTSVEGGAVIQVRGINTTSRAEASWGEDGNIIYRPRGSRVLWRVPSDGGTPEPVTTLRDGETFHTWPQVLDGGRKGSLHGTRPKWDVE